MQLPSQTIVQPTYETMNQPPSQRIAYETTVRLHHTHTTVQYPFKQTDISEAELGMTGYVMFRKDRLGRRGGEGGTVTPPPCE